jgi:hypothetical protein
VVFRCVQSARETLHLPLGYWWCNLAHYIAVQESVLNFKHVSRTRSLSQCTLEKFTHVFFTCPDEPLTLKQTNHLHFILTAHPLQPLNPESIAQR